MNMDDIFKGLQDLGGDLGQEFEGLMSRLRTDPREQEVMDRIVADIKGELNASEDEARALARVMKNIGILQTHGISELAYDKVVEHLIPFTKKLSAIRKFRIMWREPSTDLEILWLKLYNQDLVTLWRPFELLLIARLWVREVVEGVARANHDVVGYNALLTRATRELNSDVDLLLVAKLIVNSYKRANDLTTKEDLEA